MLSIRPFSSHQRVYYLVIEPPKWKREVYEKFRNPVILQKGYCKLVYIVFNDAFVPFILSFVDEFFKNVYLISLSITTPIFCLSVPVICYLPFKRKCGTLKLYINPPVRDGLKVTLTTLSEKVTSSMMNDSRCGVYCKED